jgi:2-polyprenyl-6-methoxyphenol hydroxylase-like FAD-dependent oxidoreductase
LKERCETDSKHIQVQYGWQVQSFTQDADGVDVVLTSPETGQKRRVRAQYLAGCDGAGSVVRQGLGIDLDMIDLPPCSPTCRS